MITVILPYYNSLKQMRQRTIEYFDMVEDYIKYNGNLQLIISDYGSDDDIKDVVKHYKIFDYVYTEPNEGEFFNISKCNNNALRIARNDLIFTNGVDWRYSYAFLKMVMNMFAIHGDIILEPSIAILNQDKSLKKFIHTNILSKKLIIKAGGWDERIYNWGQEDHDLINFMFFTNKISKIRISNKEITIFHLWHENKLYEEHGGKERNKINLGIAKQSFLEKRVNAVNSYWNVGKEGMEWKK